MFESLINSSPCPNCGSPLESFEVDEYIYLRCKALYMNCVYKEELPVMTREDYLKKQDALFSSVLTKML
jgi:ssDNA-binding Zn-finger/Zn-ribbon topoisomerase 1